MKINILIVDDEPVQIESLRRGLTLKGNNVLEALNAQEALTQLDKKENQIDLVLLDYAMPGMNGLDLLKVIREKYYLIPVIVMTGYIRMNDVIDLLHNRCDGFIEKPFTFSQLLQEIENVKLNQRH